MTNKTKVRAKHTSTSQNEAEKEEAIITNNASSESNRIIVDIPMDEIDISPLNDRETYSQEDLELFAKDIGMHGVQSAIWVRQMPNKRYQIIFGERRFRASKIAGLKLIPGEIREMSDQEVIQRQIAENIQRENMHPMYIARSFGRLLNAGQTIEKIALNQGKSKAFIVSRTRLLNLIDVFQKMYLAAKISMEEAFEIANISKESQQEFYQASCTDWEERSGFRIQNFRYSLSRFKYDLKEAPFDTKDKTLVPEAGACTKCPFNSATLKTLFPEFAKDPVCTNKSCYQNKCTVQLKNQFLNAYNEYQPQAILFNGTPTEELLNVIRSVPGTSDLPTYSRNDITLFNVPIEPDKKDYTCLSDEEDGNEEMLDEEAYNQAMQEYATDLDDYNQQVGNAQKGLLVSEEDTQAIFFTPEKLTRQTSQVKVTAKEVQQAIKEGKATPELLQSEIQRINDREKRAKQLDREKVQASVYKQFEDKIKEPDTITTLTSADLVAARLMIYQSLSYSARNEVDVVLFKNTNPIASGDQETRYQTFANLTDEQYSFLIRKALLGKDESKNPTSITAYFLYKSAENAGVDLKPIEEQQQEKIEERNEKLIQRTNELERRIKRINAARERLNAA